MYYVRSIIFNLDHEMDSLHFILNGEDPIPLNTLIPSTSCEAQSKYSAQALINLGPNTILTNQNIPIGL